MNQPTVEAKQERRNVSPKAVDSAKSFLSTLFMGIRTAQIHDPTNSAFDGAVRSVQEAAAQLYALAGGFSIQFVEESVFMNGARLRFASGAFQTIRKLRRLLESQEFGGVEMQAQPSTDAIRNLLLLFSPKNPAAAVQRADLAKLKINVLGIQRFSEGDKAGLKIDRNVFALQCYAKLVLAVREQRERIQREREVDWGTSSGGVPRLRAMRVVQDLVELASDRSDFLLKLVANRSGAAADELHAANVCLLAICVGQALAFDRRELVDVGVAALFHDIAWVSSAGASRRTAIERRRAADESFARMLAAGGLSKTGHLRSVLVAEQRVRAGDQFAWGKARHNPHVFSRIVGASVTFSALTLGLFEDEPLHPLDALAILSREGGFRVDPRMLDLIVNLLRAYPVGSEVLLDDDSQAMVMGHTKGARWDRPIVKVHGQSEAIDLMSAAEGRYTQRIVSTIRAAGLEAKFGPDELPPLARTLALPLASKEKPPKESLEISVNDTLELQLPDAPVAPRGVSGSGEGPDSAELGRILDALDDPVEPKKDESAPVVASRARSLDMPETPAQDDAERPPSAKPKPSRAKDGRLAEARRAGSGEGSEMIFGYPFTARSRSSKVYEELAGTDPSDGTPVSVRVLDPTRVDDKRLSPNEWGELFEREGLMAAVVSHPALPRLMDMGKGGAGLRFMVYERRPGTTLAEAREAGGVASTAAQRTFIRSLAEGLHHLHLRRLVAGALLPERIQVTESDEARLLGLELAAPANDPNHPLWPTIGRPRPPESKFDATSDQFVLGVLVYELLTGRIPGPSPEPPSAVQTGVHRSLSDATMRLLDPDPKARFRNLDELARNLSAMNALARRKPA